MTKLYGPLCTCGHIQEDHKGVDRLDACNLCACWAFRHRFTATRTDAERTIT